MAKQIRDLRIFGLIWSAIFLFFSYKFESWFFLSLAVGFFLISVINPQIFVQIKFYQGWIRFGNFLGKINGFLISFILFYVIFVPIGIILKILGKDPLRKKFDQAQDSYFIDRKDQPGDMKNQF
ncbi:MAG: hypothetical protein A2887_03495 [Alphaproteobacteria bacterium RIFCSPLOWO2_01_FULL_40_26]|nr:MAG: hypothetical protein A3D15_00695 [Alphaproteobacteria bacterium RIFCSPHIGHO2_02_FULL_40_34]OFW87979.1 MAG: hypothetical protein A2794_03010 [Alphaproteobacteria bacterium RIFCSPHIGHO2_01_FULL_40_8]OFW95438.1 MAG: hypothetical protein A2887_03495 [Alphaproteobacteria bacterium RIFCSPLOWO2_01_FULL_40_26]OFX09286.1 MAG: hypothetical protein A3H30_05375 [Alphaproteobacteria bacterium RIFCSPLOWO2_02_FULL_40_19]OFX10900.1 MAG: hypothetical protein A3G22_00990 [Alphaproteobacteria bacterium RI